VWYLKLELVGFNVDFEVETGICVVSVAVVVVSVTIVVVGDIVGRLVDSLAFVEAVKNKTKLISFSYS
jgi:hypothetical protein